MTQTLPAAGRQPACWQGRNTDSYRDDYQSLILNLIAIVIH